MSISVSRYFLSCVQLIFHYFSYLLFDNELAKIFDARMCPGNSWHVSGDLVWTRCIDFKDILKHFDAQTELFVVPLGVHALPSKNNWTRRLGSAPKCLAFNRFNDKFICESAKFHGANDFPMVSQDRKIVQPLTDGRSVEIGTNIMRLNMLIIILF